MYIMKSYSQIGQDLEVLKRYNNKTDGFFVEIGASDGIELSNTYLLETNFNWKGICVEPIPNRYKLLCQNRPNSVCFDNAVYGVSNAQVIFDIANNTEDMVNRSDVLLRLENLSDYRGSVQKKQ